MIDRGFCPLCGRRFDADPHREHDENNHIDCLEKLMSVCSEKLTNTTGI